ncbi:formylglycine-generating enzyme family protein [uncultured Desulfobacter sp.]|uniref:formylglycine-generating enzyme family protein n=1 Tax=uncultured Desulfobacter sp. TaxID=240139 RepID=UPI0037481F6F
MEIFRNSIGMEFIYVPSGTGVIGSSVYESTRRENESPQHSIRLNGFWIARFPTTQKEYSQVIGVNPSYFSAFGQGSAHVRGVDTSKFPVESVSWFDAESFCSIMAALPNERESNRTYRLPFESEWEYACRSTTSTAFSCGSTFSSYHGNIDGRYPYGCDDIGPSAGRPTTVGSYAPNTYGLYDMHGNVWEWCANLYTSNYGPSPRKSSSARVLRGGAWTCYSRFCRSAYRSCGEASIHYYDQGFRVICISSI